MIPPGVRERLAAHVDAVLAGARVPATHRAEIAEELLGHLIQRVKELLTDGLTPHDAAERAIRDFGGAERIGRDFTRTYHGRLWASTIGVLLPAGTPAGRPLAVTLFWILALAMSAVYLLLAGWALAHHPPIRALVLGVGGATASGAILLVGLALRRARGWALDVATAGSLILVVLGVVELASGRISLGGLLALAALLVYFNDPLRVRRWMTPAPEPRGAVIVAVIAIGLPLLQPVAVDFPDPTQAEPKDLHITAWMECTENPRGGTVTVELEWARTSLAPGGAARLDRFGDALVLEMNDQLAAPYGVTRLVEVSTGESVAEPGQHRAAADEMLWQLAGPAVIGIDHGRLDPGRHYRATWAFEAREDADLRDLQAGVEYWHADHFRTEALIDCDGMVLDWWTVPAPLPSGA